MGGRGEENTQLYVKRAVIPVKLSLMRHCFQRLGQSHGKRRVSLASQTSILTGFHRRKSPEAKR